MRAVVKKWGNSASVRIPLAVLQAAHLDLDDPVDVREESGRIVIVIEPVRTNRSSASMPRIHGVPRNGRRKRVGPHRNTQLHLEQDVAGLNSCGLMPALISSFTIAELINPVAPVTKTRISNLLFMSVYCVEVGKDFSWNLQRRGLKILAKMLDGGCARNQQDVGRTLKKPGKRNLHRGGLELRGDLRQGGRL